MSTCVSAADLWSLVASNVRAASSASSMHLLTSSLLLSESLSIQNSPQIALASALFSKALELASLYSWTADLYEPTASCISSSNFSLVEDSKALLNRHLPRRSVIRPFSQVLSRRPEDNPSLQVLAAASQSRPQTFRSMSARTSLNIFVDETDKI